MVKTRLVLCVLMAAVVTCTVSIADEANPKQTLTFIWHAGDRANLLQKIALEYTKKTGVDIKAVLPPMTNAWYQQIADEFARKGSAFDLVIFDSQNMSEFASQGHIVRLNDFLKQSPMINATDFDPSALKRYAEYPEGSDNIYALPINQDCMGLVYRQDLLDDPKEKTAFKTKYNYELAVPETYDQLRDIAEFFTRPDHKLFGLGLYGSEDYDACTSAFLNLFWSFGAELWDPKTNKAEGYINSPQAEKALAFFKGLFAFAPPGSQDAYVPEVNKAIKAGQVAMAIQWYYFFNELLAGTVPPARLGFATLPGEKDAAGKMHRFVMVGGQGVSISSYSKHKDEAWKFLEWFMSPPQQRKWVEGGGMTGLAVILNGPKFLEAAPPNKTFPFSMSLTKDYWHLPTYPKLLQTFQHYVHQAIIGRQSSDQALDACAAEQQRILQASTD